MDRKAAVKLYLKGEEATVAKLLELSEKLASLEKENTTLKEKLTKAANYKPKKKKSRKRKPWWKWGRKKGHVGSHRLVPDHVDETLESTLERCPDCDKKLSKSQDVMEHIQEDIVPSTVVVTKFLRHRYWCCGCKHIVTAPPSPNEIPCAYLGPNTLAQMVLLKYHHGLPGNKIVELFREFCGLKVSEGAVFKALQRLAFWMDVEKKQILQAIRKSPHNHMDETGGKIDGVKHWLWATVNPKWAHYVTHPSRGAKVVKQILGEKYQGGLVTDFYAAYDRVSVGNQQKCRVHLRREMKSLKTRDAPSDYLIPYKKLKRILDDADRLKELRLQLGSFIYHRRVRRIEKRLLDFACAAYSNAHWKRLSKRLLKHHKSIFRDLHRPELPADNNFAERMIRQHVILRNRSYQHRTVKGAAAYDSLTSILHSLRLQARNPMAKIRQAYLHHRQEKPGIVMFPAADGDNHPRRTSIG